MTPVISLIAAHNEIGAIGYENRLLWRLPDDLKFFQQKTQYKPIIMGRKTYESIGKPLPQRHNIMMTRSKEEIAGITVVGSVRDAVAAAGEAEEIMVIGGAEIYKAFLPLARRMYLTLVENRLQGDVYFPEFDHDVWKITRTTYHPADEKHAWPFSFVEWELPVRRPAGLDKVE